MEKKYTAHVPVEQFGYISVDIEGEAEEAVAAYREIAEAVKVQPKSDISTAEFGRIAAEYLKSGMLKNGGDLEFSPAQKYVLKLITSVVRTNKQ